MLIDWLIWPKRSSAALVYPSFKHLPYLDCSCTCQRIWILVLIPPLNSSVTLSKPSNRSKCSVMGSTLDLESGRLGFSSCFIYFIYFIYFRLQSDPGQIIWSSRASVFSSINEGIGPSDFTSILIQSHNIAKRFIEVIGVKIFCIYKLFLLWT